MAHCHRINSYSQSSVVARLLIQEYADAPDDARRGARRRQAVRRDDFESIANRQRRRLRRMNSQQCSDAVRTREVYHRHTASIPRRATLLTLISFGHMLHGYFSH